MVVMPGADVQSPPPPLPNANLRQKHVQQLMKTEMCKFFLRKHCGKGAKCAYAHSLTEIREKPNLSRTSMCRSFLQTGNCEDPSCSFAHTELQLRTTSGFFKTKICRFAGSGRCKHGSACRFAHNKEESHQLEDDATPAVQVACKTNQQNWFDMTSDQSTRADTNSSGQTTEGSGESGPGSGESGPGSSESGPEEMPKKDRGKKADGSRPARHCTTMMLSNVPNFLTQGALVSLLEDLTLGMRGAFDFFYCPWDPYEDKNLGYAIVNFFARSVAADFEKQWANKPLLQGTRGMKKLRIVPAALQGRAANLRHFSGFGLAHHVDPRFRPLMRAGPSEILRPMAISQEMIKQTPAIGNTTMSQSSKMDSSQQVSEALPTFRVFPCADNGVQSFPQAPTRTRVEKIAAPVAMNTSPGFPIRRDHTGNVMDLLQQMGSSGNCCGVARGGARGEVGSEVDVLLRRLANEATPAMITPNGFCPQVSQFNGGSSRINGEALLQRMHFPFMMCQTPYGSNCIQEQHGTRAGFGLTNSGSF